MNPAPEPVRQRATLVLPSSGAFDSRAWRIASALAARGHDVTVIGRLEPGVAAEETHPSGYRIIRVPVSAAAGLPGPLRALWARFRAAPGQTGQERPGSPSTGSARHRGVLGHVRSAWAAVVRLAAIALTVRSQRIATRPLAPAADLVHAMAYMGIPIGLDLGRRDRAVVVYDARDIYLNARNLARMGRPARWLLGRLERTSRPTGPLRSPP